MFMLVYDTLHGVCGSYWPAKCKTFFKSGMFIMILMCKVYLYNKYFEVTEALDRWSDFFMKNKTACFRSTI